MRELLELCPGCHGGSLPSPALGGGELTRLVGLLGALAFGCGDGGEGNRNQQNLNGNQLALCGNGVKEATEECDDGAANSDLAIDACRTDCRLAHCGDGIADSAEVCDDGNRTAGDGCSADCRSDESCGNGIADVDESCDGSDLAGEDCQSQGHGAGALSCGTDCRFDLSGCYTCGNGACEAGENNAVCPGECRATDVAPGGAHTCGTRVDGSVWCWGHALYGQLGNDQFSTQTTPNRVEALSEAMAVSSGGNHSCALRSDGTLWCWGENCYGGLGDGIAHQGCSGCDCSAVPVQVSGLTDAVAVATGVIHTCALLGDGTVWCWGYNGCGQLGDGTTEDHSTPVPVPGIAGAQAIAGSGGHTCALLEDGSIACWGLNVYGELGDAGTHETCDSEQWYLHVSQADFSPDPVSVSGISGATAVSAGLGFTCALLGNGSVWCWGVNDCGQLGDGSVPEDCDFQYDREPAPPVNLVAIPVTGLDGIVSLSAGNNFACAVDSAAQAWCWGGNELGQLGDGGTVSRGTPRVVSGLEAIAAISAGSDHTCALTDEGRVWCWGYNASGELGDGSTTQTPVPVSTLDWP